MLTGGVDLRCIDQRWNGGNGIKPEQKGIDEDLHLSLSDHSSEPKQRFLGRSLRQSTQHHNEADLLTV